MFDTHLGFTTPVLVASTPGAQQSGLAYPIAPMYDTSQVKLVRANLFLQALTVGNNLMEVQVGWQLSDDGVNWPASTASADVHFFTTAISRQIEGTTSNGAFEDILSSMTKKYVRFVLWVKNVGANQALSTCLASIRIERFKQ